MEDGVPTIDLAPLFWPDAFSQPHSAAFLEVVQQIDAASRCWGFYQVLNHSISEELLERLEERSRTFFHSDSGLKKACRKSSPAVSLGFFDNEFTKNVRDWKEGFDFGLWEREEEVNLWPDLPNFKETMTEYFFELDRLSMLLHKVTAIALKQDPDFFEEHMDESKHPSICRLNYYPVLTGDQEVLGVNPHQDGGTLTIIRQDIDVSGLQVYRGTAGEFNTGSDEGWVTVEPVAGALVVNVGMMLEVWSNMQYKAALHRVLANNSRVRYSAPYFKFPSYKTTVKPILTPESPLPFYRDIQYGEFRRLLYEGFSREIPLDKQARLPNYRIIHT